MAEQEDPGAQSPKKPVLWIDCFLSLVAILVLAQLSGIQMLLNRVPMESIVHWARLGLAGAALVTFLIFWPDVRRTLSSMRFGILVLVSLLLASMVGTLVPQQQHPTGFREDFVAAQSSFVWTLTNPLARLSQPPLEKDKARDWLEKRQIPRAEMITSQLPLGPDLVAQRQLFGDRSADELSERVSQSLQGTVRKGGSAKELQRSAAFYQDLYELAQWLQLTWIWQTSWFASLVGLLALCLGLTIFRRRSFSLRTLGLWCAHGGLLIAILGALLGRLGEERGFLPLRVGMVSDSFAPDRGDGGGDHFFADRQALQLSAFKTVPHYQLNLGVDVDQELAAILPQGLQGDFYRHGEKNLAPGVTIPILVDSEGDPRWRISVKEFLPWVKHRQEWLVADEEDSGAGSVAIFSRLDHKGRVKGELTLPAPPDESGIMHLGEGRRILLVNCRTAAEMAAWKQGKGLDGYGTLRLRVKGGPWQEAPLVEGGKTSLDTEAGKVGVQIWRVMQDFKIEYWGGIKGIYGERLQPGGSALQPENSRERNAALDPQNPAAALVLVGPSGVDRLFAFRTSMAGHGNMGHKTKYPDIEAQLDFSELRCPAKERLIVVTGPEPAYLVRTIGAKVISAKPYSAGDKVELGGEELRVDRFLARARSRLVVERVIDGDPLFHNHPAALRLAVEGPDGTREFTLVSTTATMLAAGEHSPFAQARYSEQLQLQLEEQLAMPKDWFSKLAVYRIDHPRAKSGDGVGLVIPVLAQANWTRFLAKLKETGADTAALLDKVVFGTEALRRTNLVALDQALWNIMVRKKLAFWRERLPADLCVEYAEWIKQRMAEQVAAKTIRVNDPLVLPASSFAGLLGGYQISQSDARPEDPTYSGFQIVMDPGVNIARWGMIIMVIGSFLLFMGRPERRVKPAAPVAEEVPA